MKIQVSRIHRTWVECSGGRYVFLSKLSSFDLVGCYCSFISVLLLEFEALDVHENAFVHVALVG